MFLTNKTVVYGKLESTPYTGETLADADFDVRVSDVSYSFDVQEYRRKIADGTLDFSASVKGKQSATVSFKVDLAPGAAADDEPEWSKMLEACGFKKTAYGSTGIGWVPHADNTHTPVTIEVQEIEEGASPDALRVRLVGAMGNVTFTIGQVGEPTQMNFEFTGMLDVIDDRTSAQRIDPTAFNTVCPPPILSATITVNSIAQELDTFEFNMNNDVQMWTDPSKAEGIKGAYVAGREPQMTLDPMMTLLATEDWYAELIGDCTTRRAVSVSYSSSPLITLSAPKAHLIAVAPGERNGARTAEKTFLLTKDSGNDVFEVLQGAKA